MEEHNKREEKQAAGEIVVKNRFTVWIENFWYHHKGAVIVVGFFLLLGIVCFAQCSTRASGDLTVSFAGSYTLDGEERAAIVDVLESIAPQKADKSGTLTMLINDYSVYTEEELRAMCTDEKGEYSPAAFANAKQVNSDHLKTFGTYVMAGECAFWLVSDFVYKEQNLENLAVPLTELFDTTPTSAVKEGAVGHGYAVRLGDTALYQYYDALKVLPADTLLVMPKPIYGNIFEPTIDEEKYEECLQMYRAIVEFRAP